MSSTSLYTLVAGASLLLALWQPADADTPFTAESPAPAGASAQGESLKQRIDDRVARHKQRWEQREVERKASSGAGS